MLGRWLDQFSGAAGGAVFRVQVGSGEYAFDRVLRETSASYILGVEPAEEDRDGRTHEVTVKTNQKGLVIRGSRWVTVPKRSAAAAIPSEAAPSPAAPKEPPPPPPRVVPADIQAMADAYDRGEAGFSAELWRTHRISGPAPQLPWIGYAVAERPQTYRGVRAASSRWRRSRAKPERA